MIKARRARASTFDPDGVVAGGVVALQTGKAAAARTTIPPTILRFLIAAFSLDMSEQQKSEPAGADGLMT
jgi:hypothetical protein